MKKYLLLCLICGATLAPWQSASAQRSVTDFNEGWRFSLDADSFAYRESFDDSGWRTLDLPHDWSIESDFSEEYPATAGGGALPGGIGWYRKTFRIPDSEGDRRTFLEFDGIYWNSTVWVNGHPVGFRPNGYLSFRYDITPYLNNGENSVAVRVDNSRQPNSRWYSGSGIYRDVRLVSTDPVHVDLWGTCITTPTILPDQADIRIETTLRNLTERSVPLELEHLIIDPEGSPVASWRSGLSVPAGQADTHTAELQLADPRLWSTDSPELYKTVTTVYRTSPSGEPAAIDRYETVFGIRDFSFDPERGFFLNGQHLPLRGVCQHHDLGCLGAALNVRALERQLEILKAMGCNSIRTAHNPPAPALLDLCDRMGIVVMNEIFDMWRKKKSPYDYAEYFSEWYEKDLTDWVLRDRNHPSVVMWSIGNEILEQWTDINTDTLDLQQANMMFNFASTLSDHELGEELHINSLLTIRLAEIVKNLDPTRPVTSGNNEAGTKNHLFRSGAMDIIGINYNENKWKDLPKNYPGKPFIITESTSSLMSRGHYEMPSDSVFIRPERWDKPFFKEGNQTSSYDNCHAPWGSTHEKSLRLFNRYDFIAGIYVWTGFDYLGEPTPYWWPSRSSYFGIVDLAGFPKDVYHLYRSEWTDQQVLHLFPHWNWEPGQEVDLWAYYNHADEVELFLNGESLGKRSKEGDQMHVQWRVPFSPGTLRAVSRRNGVEVLVREIRTAGDPVSLRLTADRTDLHADGKDLSFVTVEALDAEGHPVPVADRLIRFSIEGPGVIAGTDNGDPTDHKSLTAPERRLFSGKALAVVKTKKEEGPIVLTAESDGLPPVRLTLRSR